MFRRPHALTLGPWLACVLLWLVPSLGGVATEAALGTSTSGHYLRFRERPLLIAGDSGTQCVLQNGNLDFRRWIDDCAASGLNTVHVWSFVAPRQKLDGSELEARYGYVFPGLTPWARKTSGARAHDGGYQWDLHQWDEEGYWPRFRALCAAARSRDLLLGITVFWGWPKHGSDWIYHPFNVVNGGPISDEPRPYVTLVQQIASPGTEVLGEAWSEAWPPAKKNQWHWERFAEKLITETSAYDNVFFVFMDEHSYSDGNGAAHFREFFQKRGCLWTDRELRRADVDFVFDPVTHRDEGGRNPECVERFLRAPARPFMILEGGPYQGEIARVSFWSALMGGAGTVYHNDAEQETVHTGIMGYDPKVPGGDTGATRRQWLGIASRFFNASMPDLDAMAPHNELTGSGAFCLAQPGMTYAVYAPPGGDGEVSLDLSGAPGRFTARFYDPVTGNWQEPQTVDGGARVTLARPSLADWALLVTRVTN